MSGSTWRDPPDALLSRKKNNGGDSGYEDDGYDEDDDYELGRLGKTALGDLSVAQAQWWNSYFDMMIKLTLLFTYIMMALFSAAFWVPLTLNAIVNAIYLFVFPFAFALISAILLILAIIDSFNIGLSYEGIDALGRSIIVSFRDRTANVLLSGVSLTVNVIMGIMWAVWYGRHNDLNSISDYSTFGQGVAQYYALLAAGACFYTLTPIFALFVVYANVRYEMAVHLVDTVVSKGLRKNLEKLLGQPS